MSCHFDTENYLCAHCWGRVIETYQNGKSDIVCVNGCKDAGFVTKAYVEMRRREDKADAAEARYNLRDILPNPLKDKTPEEILSELGF